jgi:hypothetical protein
MHGCTFLLRRKIGQSASQARQVPGRGSDNHGIPEVRIGPEGEAYKGWSAYFTDWEQFERFAEAVQSVRSRLGGRANG